MHEKSLKGGFCRKGCVCVEISLYLIMETCVTCDEDSCKEGSFISIYGQQKFDR